MSTQTRRGHLVKIQARPNFVFRISQCKELKLSIKFSAGFVPSLAIRQRIFPAWQVKDLKCTKSASVVGLSMNVVFVTSLPLKKAQSSIGAQVVLRATRPFI